MKIILEVATTIATIEDTDEEFNTIHQAFQLIINALKAVGYQDDSIKAGLNQLKTSSKN